MYMNMYINTRPSPLVVDLLLFCHGSHHVPNQPQTYVDLFLGIMAHYICSSLVSGLSSFENHHAVGQAPLCSQISNKQLLRVETDISMLPTLGEGTSFT